MGESELHIVLVVLFVGVTIVLSILIKAGLERVRVPALIGYMGLGFLFRLLDSDGRWFSAEAWWVYRFLADIGIIVLLFRIGLESNLAGLLRQLRYAIGIWMGNVLFSGILGYVVSYYLLDLALLPSLFVTIAFTATSVGVSAGVWQEAAALKSPSGELLLDVAEMDDISGLMLMSLLFAVVPVLRGDANASLLPIITKTTGLLFLSLLAFGAVCLFFSRYIEQPLTNFFLRIEPPPNPMLMVAGTGFIIAALAGLWGFSVAIGAFFAGLVFSRDPQSVKIDASFDAISALFSPFFFIGIGLQIDPAALTTAFGAGPVLLIAAIAGKVVGTVGPALLMLPWTNALVLGVSMVPRAEIALIIMQHGVQLGDWAVPAPVFAAMALVSAVTCVAAPLVLLPLLRQWPQTRGVPA